MSKQDLGFTQLHIDVARNATDDFNPFHDPLRFQRVAGNPFGAPIALGFQLEFLAADRVERYRSAHDDHDPALRADLCYSNYEFRFAAALRADEPFVLEVKPTVDRLDRGDGLSNRVVIRRAGGDLVLTGTQSETATPRFLADALPQGLPSLEHFPDRIPLPGTPYFLKRKYLNTANGKNFALGALCAQQDYFDELAEQVHFPPLFTAALLSSALLEKGQYEGYDFAAAPLVYTSHQISVDNRLQRQLRSNDVLYLLVEGPDPLAAPQGLGSRAPAQQRYRCYGLVHRRQLLFRASVQLAPLRTLKAPD
jgi:hypothetical protein